MNVKYTHELIIKCEFQKKVGVLNATAITFKHALFDRVSNSRDNYMFILTPRISSCGILSPELKNQ
jgi:hypothetical protein